MPYDGFVMRRFIDYARKRLIGSYIKNFYFQKNVIYIAFQDVDLKISLNPSYSYITFEKRNISNVVKHHFVDFLRSRVKGGRLKDIITFGFERTVKFVVEKVDEIGIAHEYEMYVDIMGKHSNMILVENGVILDAYRRVKNRFRNIYPGEIFVFYKSDKINPYNVSNIKNIEKLYLEVQGFSKITVRELIYRMQFLDFHKALKSILRDFEKGCLYVFYQNNVPIEISAFPLNHINAIKKKYCKELENAISDFFGFVERNNILKQLKKNLENIIVKNVVKIENTLEKINRELQEIKDYEHYRKYGELLKAYFYQIPIGTKEVELFDWENNENIIVPLDPNKDAIENASSYFKKYNKLKTKLKGLLNRKKYLEKELNYLYQLWYTLEEVDDLNEVEDIKSEMEDVGILKVRKRRKNNVKSEPIKVSFKNHSIYIGKNNKQNDELVRNSSDEDIWLHVSGMPGAHVIIKHAGREITNDVIEYAASLAAGYSKGKNSGKVLVDYTKAKNVRKVKGLKPGMVLYYNYRTIIVNPRRIDDV